MAYVSRRRMELAGEKFDPGDPIPQAVIDRIAPRRLRSMRRVGTVIEAPGAVATLQREGDGDMCEICGGGPFVRLAQHVTKMHENEES